MRLIAVRTTIAATLCVAALTSCSTGSSGDTSASGTTSTAVPSTSASPTTTRTTSATRSTTTTSGTTTVSGSATSSGTTSATTSAAGPTETWATNPLYVGDIPEDQFVKGEPNQKDIKINGTTFQHSWVWQGPYPSVPANLTAEFNIPLGYQALEFTLGMTDDTSVDADQDGVASVTIYVGGNIAYGPTEFKYTDATPVSVPIGGKSRIRVDISGITSNEYAALASARFTR